MRLLAPKGMGQVSMSKSLSPAPISPGKAGRGFGQLMHGQDGSPAHAAPPRGAALAAKHPAHEEPDEGMGARPKRRPPEEPPLDPTARQAAQLAPPVAASPAFESITGSGALEAHARASLEGLLPALVRRVAWSGDGRRGTVRLELGGGELAGGTLLIHADSGRVAVHLSAPGGTNLAQWRDRIAARLTARGLDVEAVEVE
jgi:hypothetical protein